MNRVYCILVIFSLVSSCKKEEVKENSIKNYTVSFWQEVGSGYDTTLVHIVELDTFYDRLITTERIKDPANCNDNGLTSFLFYFPDEFDSTYNALPAYSAPVKLSTYSYIATEQKPGGKVWEGTFALEEDQCVIFKLE